jgi:cation transport ATPase
MTAELTLPIRGMSCASCAGRVEKALRAACRRIAKAGYQVATVTNRLHLEGINCASCVSRTGCPRDPRAKLRPRSMRSSPQTGRSLCNHIQRRTQEENGDDSANGKVRPHRSGQSNASTGD